MTKKTLEMVYVMNVYFYLDSIDTAEKLSMVSKKCLVAAKSLKKNPYYKRFTRDFSEMKQIQERTDLIKRELKLFSNIETVQFQDELKEEDLEKYPLIYIVNPMVAMWSSDYYEKPSIKDKLVNVSSPRLAGISTRRVEFYSDPDGMATDVEDQEEIKVNFEEINDNWENLFSFKGIDKIKNCTITIILEYGATPYEDEESDQRFYSVIKQILKQTDLESNKVIIQFPNFSKEFFEEIEKYEKKIKFIGDQIYAPGSKSFECFCEGKYYLVLNRNYPGHTYIPLSCFYDDRFVEQINKYYPVNVIIDSYNTLFSYEGNETFEPPEGFEECESYDLSKFTSIEKIKLFFIRNVEENIKPVVLPNSIRYLESQFVEIKNIDELTNLKEAHVDFIPKGLTSLTKLTLKPESVVNEDDLKTLPNLKEFKREVNQNFNIGMVNGMTN